MTNLVVVFQYPKETLYRTIAEASLPAVGDVHVANGRDWTVVAVSRATGRTVVSLRPLESSSDA